MMVVADFSFHPIVHEFYDWRESYNLAANLIPRILNNLLMRMNLPHFLFTPLPLFLFTGLLFRTCNQAQRLELFGKKEIH